MLQLGGKNRGQWLTQATATPAATALDTTSATAGSANAARGATGAAARRRRGLWALSMRAWCLGGHREARWGAGWRAAAAGREGAGPSLAPSTVRVQAMFEKV